MFKPQLHFYKVKEFTSNWGIYKLLYNSTYMALWKTYSCRKKTGAYQAWDWRGRLTTKE